MHHGHSEQVRGFELTCPLLVMNLPREASKGPGVAAVLAFDRRSSVTIAPRRAHSSIVSCLHRELVSAGSQDVPAARAWGDQDVMPILRTPPRTGLSREPTGIAGGFAAASDPPAGKRRFRGHGSREIGAGALAPLVPER